MPEILGVMVESCAPSGCRACSVRSPCTCRSRSVGILEIAGIQAPVRGPLSGARTICIIPSGKSQCVKGGVIFADWWSRQCVFKLSVLTHVGHSRVTKNFFFFGGFSQHSSSRSPREGVDTCRGRALNALGRGYYGQANRAAKATHGTQVHS